EAFACRELVAELGRLGRQFRISESLRLLLEGVDSIDAGLVGADAALVCRAEEFAGQSAEADHSNGPFWLNVLVIAGRPTALHNRQNRPLRPETHLDAKLRDR